MKSIQHRWTMDPQLIGVDTSGTAHFGNSPNFQRFPNQPAAQQQSSQTSSINPLYLEQQSRVMSKQHNSQNEMHSIRLVSVLYKTYNVIFSKVKYFLSNWFCALELRYVFSFC